MSYKSIRKNLTWGIYLQSEQPWQEVYVDCDSLIFEYIKEYCRKPLSISQKITLHFENIVNTDLLLEKIIKNVTWYCTKRLQQTTASLREEGLKLHIVFGKGHIPEKQETIDKRNRYRTQAKEKLCNNKSVTRFDAIMKTANIICSYLYSSRDAVRDIVRTRATLLHKGSTDWFNDDHKISTEPDRYCAITSRNSPNSCVYSHDLDVFLFGARCVIREPPNPQTFRLRRRFPQRSWEVPPNLSHHEPSKEFRGLRVPRLEVREFLTIDSLLAQVGVEGLQKFIELAILSGTDYNPAGVKSIGPTRALRIVNTVGLIEFIKSRNLQVERFEELLKLFDEARS
jgi:5'-3' exonuclease